MANIISNDLNGEYEEFGDWISQPAPDQTILIYRWCTKTVYTVVQDITNFKWKVRIQIYLKAEISQMGSATPGWYGLGIGVHAGTQTDTGENINKAVKETLNYQIVYDNEFEFNISITGIYAILIYNNSVSASSRTRLYLTLPAFSGMKYKINNNYKQSMPWIKDNGVWKRCLQWIKVDGVWKKYNNTFIWDPED